MNILKGYKTLTAVKEFLEVIKRLLLNTSIGQSAWAEGHYEDSKLSGHGNV